MVTALALALLLPNGIVVPKGHRAFQLSPDHRYLAVTVFGEAESSFLYIVAVGRHINASGISQLRKIAEKHAMGGGAPEPKPTLLEVMDVDSFLWIPGKPHMLVYGESGIYGDGVIETFNVGSKPRKLVEIPEPESEVFLKTYDPAKHRLTYVVVQFDSHDREVSRRRSVRLKLR